MTLRTAAPPLIIHNFWRNEVHVYPMPEWPTWWWCWTIIRSVKWWFLGKMIGCFASYHFEALLGLTPTLETPSSKIGQSLFIADLSEHKSRPLDSWENLERYSVEHTESVGFLHVEALQQSRNNYKVLIQAVIFRLAQQERLDETSKQ